MTTREKFAQDIRKVLGPLNDNEKPVLQLVKEMIAKLNASKPVAQIVSGYSGDPDTWNDLDIKKLDLTGLRPGDLLYARPRPSKLIEWTEDEASFSLLCYLVEDKWVPDMETLETSATYPTGGSSAWLHIQEKASELARSLQE